MFGLFASQNKKMRTTATHWVEMADKVWDYRRDVLSEADRRELKARTEELREKISEKKDAAELKLGIESLEPVLQRTGGKIYPKTTMIDNVEFFLVAAIVVLGFRAFIAQPFKIPTNSMWPSYYGMTADNLLVRDEKPSTVGAAFRFLTLGADRETATAAQAGELSFKIIPDGRLAWTEVSATKWLVIPQKYREYTFYVGSTESKVRVPIEFGDFDSVVHESLYGSTEAYTKALQQAAKDNKFESSRQQTRSGSNESYGTLLMHTGKRYAAGQDVLRFDILTGDLLFVDRVSYHFVEPKIGDGFVFRTGNIADIGSDQYYIKRLVGKPGDKLEIREPVLYRNGAPITGSMGFEKNNKKLENYAGYLDSTSLAKRGAGLWPYLKRGETLTVPANSFFALGDNSANSRDSRGWGFVPGKDVIGRPLFIYYPFTNRVGGMR